jgi:hypothetical protein
MNKNEKKAHFAIRKNVFSFTTLFWAGSLALHFQDDF